MSDFDGDDRRTDYETDLAEHEPEDQAEAESEDEYEENSGAATNYMAEYDQGTARGRTRYEDRATIEDRAAYQEAGQVLGPDGQPMTGTYGWVVDDETGYLLFLHPDQVVVHHPNGDFTVTRDELVARRAELRAAGATIERIHHTTPVAGMPVAGAGIMELDDGWIVSVSDESGHYRPTAENQYNALVGLEEQGYSLERPVDAEDSPDGVAGYRGATVSLTGAVGSGDRPTSKADWLAEEKANNPYLSTDELELRWEQFEQTGGDEIIARRRDALNREFLARGGAAILRQVPPADLQADPNFELDPTNNLFRDAQTYAYYSPETGDLVYQYDSSTQNYVDVEGNPIPASIYVDEDGNPL